MNVIQMESWFFFEMFHNKFHFSKQRKSAIIPVYYFLPVQFDPKICTMFTSLYNQGLYNAYLPYFQYIAIAVAIILLPIIGLIILRIVLKLTTGRCKSLTCLNGKTAIVTGGGSGMFLSLFYKGSILNYLHYYNYSQKFLNRFYT